MILLCRQPENDVKPLLAADLRAFLYLNYPATADAETLAEWLEGELKKNDKLVQKLNNGGREHFLSVRRLRGIGEGIGIHLNDKQAEALAEGFPTLQRWQTVEPDAVVKAAGLRPGTAKDLIDEVLVKANPS